VSPACHDPDFDPAKESHQMALTLKVFVQTIEKSQTLSTLILFIVIWLEKRK
jgi:hypothetical protein